MFRHIRTPKHICSSEQGHVNILTAGGAACLALDAVYALLADEVKVPIAVLLAVAGVAGIAAGVMNQPSMPARPKRHPGSPTPRPPVNQMPTVHQPTTSSAPKPAAFTKAEIDDALQVLAKLNAVYKYL